MADIAVFVCPICGAETAITEDLAGRSGPCYNCGKRVTIPPFRSRAADHHAVDHHAGTFEARPVEGLAVGSPGLSSGVRLSDRDAVRRQSEAILTGRRSPGLIRPLALGLLVAVGLVGSLATLLWVTSQARHWGLVAGHPRQAAVEKIRTLGLALEAYHADWGAYPPAATTDESGRPLHSWRTLLLPYLGHRHLYDQVDLTLPWDDPDQPDLAAVGPDVYRAPDDPSPNRRGTTSYVVIAGPEAVFEIGAPRRRTEISDTAPSPILVIEAHQSETPWFEPVDPPFRSSTFVLDQGGPASPGAAGRPTLAVLSDGQVVELDTDLLPAQLRGLTTRNGGERIDTPRMRILRQ